MGRPFREGVALVASEVSGVSMGDVRRHAWFGLLLKAWAPGARCMTSPALFAWLLPLT